MLDRNNINRVRGVLSAKKGAEIPKFTPGGPLDRPFYILNGKFFLDGKEVTKEKFFKDRRVLESLNDHFKDITNEDKYLGANVAVNLNSNESLNGGTPKTEIIGAPDVTPTVQPVTTTNPTNTSLNGTGAQTQVIGGTTTDPNTSVVKAAEVVTQVANELDRQKALELTLAVLEATKDQQKVVDTAGMNANGEKDGDNKEDDDKEDDDSDENNIWGKIRDKAILTSIEAFNGIGAAVGALLAATDSNTTKIADTLYDSAAGFAESFGPVGQFVGTAMKNAAVAGDIIQSLGGGTDQLTTTDKWMDSSFFSWNIGMINGFFGKEADKFSADQDILASVGSSYGGTSFDINEAAKKSGKKYGLFSSGARMKANQEMAEARAKQNTMGDISDTATMLRLSVQSMGELAGLAYSMLTDGGYNLKYTYAAKQGGIIEWNPVIELEWQPQVELNWDLHILKEGGTIDLVEELEWIPEFQSGGKTRTLELLIEYAKEKNPRFIQRLSEEPKGLKFVDNNSNESVGNVYLLWNTDDLGNAIIYPRILEFVGLLKFLSSDDAFKRAIEQNNYLRMSPKEAEIFFSEDPEYGTAYKRGWPKMFSNFSNKAIIQEKNGGSLKEESNTPEIEETTLKNVIPEGALHKNKHHMDHAEGLTKKGIPVIDEDGELQAEIELNEIIFTLEVTKQLEEYYNIFYSEESTNKEKEQAALDAGKLLVYQILENTEDRTGLIESCKKGGTLQLKKSTDDLIEEVLDWMPTLVVVEEIIEETKEKEEKEEEKPKKKSEKEQMKEAIKEVLIELLTK